MSALDIAAWAERVGADLDEAVIAIKIELFNGVVSNTRWKTGRLRGHWQVSNEQPMTSTIERLDPNGTTVGNAIEATVTVNGVEYLTNNLPYAAIWNERDGIIDREFARLNQIIAGAV